MMRWDRERGSGRGAVWWLADCGLLLLLCLLLLRCCCCLHRFMQQHKAW
jgi:hypothetical protein